MLDRRLVKPPQVWLGGVRAEGSGVGSLILSPDGFLLRTFFAFLVAGGVAGRVPAALHLLAQVLVGPSLGAFDEAPPDLALRVRAKIGTARISISPLKPGMGVVKLPRP
jgi:hypothetical protein